MRFSRIFPRTASFLSFMFTIEAPNPDRRREADTSIFSPLIILSAPPLAAFVLAFIAMLFTACVLG